MASIPNPKNSELLRKMVVEYELSDPFRVLHPSVHSFTYLPFGLTRKNRSRLDFLLISQNILPSLLDCEISSAPAIGLFDHKSVTLKLGQFKKKLKIHYLSSETRVFRIYCTTAAHCNPRSIFRKLSLP